MSRTAQGLLVRFAGEVDATLEDPFVTVVDHVRGAGLPVEVDLGAVRLLGAFGVRALVALHEAAGPGRLTVRAVSVEASATLAVCAVVLPASPGAAPLDGTSAAGSAGTVPQQVTRAARAAEVRADATLELNDLVASCASLDTFVQAAADLVALRLGAVQVRVALYRPGVPAVTSRALEDGLRPVARAVRLLGSGARVVVDVHGSAQPDPDVAWLAEVYADALARAVPLQLRLSDQAQISEDLQAAMASRSVIDQAIGVIMAQNRCTGPEAFAILRSASQNRNVKLRDVAAELLVNLTGTPPQTAPFRPRDHAEPGGGTAAPSA
ncbi:ANTAR domain-containing protein [Cellulomonas sp. NPDC055163]